MAARQGRALARTPTPAHPAAVENTVELYREPVEMSEAGQALAVYIEARDRMNGAHEEFLAVLGRPDANVTEARLIFDEAEREMQRARRRWWLAVCAERQDRTPSGD